MILIETDKWLGEVQTRLSGRVSRTPLEQKILDLATQARQHLRFEYEPSAHVSKLPSPSLAQIDNHIGEGISQFAYAGAIGPLFPAAANILALNQSWVADTMHQGAVRTAFKNAGSTAFVLNAMAPAAIDDALITLNLDKQSRFYPIGEAGNPDRQLVAAFKRPLMACLLGHLAGVAAHVVLQPYIMARVLAPGGIERRRLEVQLDAQVARGYFKHQSLRAPTFGPWTPSSLGGVTVTHSTFGQSWTAYFPDDDLGVEMIAELYLKSFQQTYPKAPSEPLCTVPTVADLRTRFPALGTLLDDNPRLAENLAHFSDYDHLLDGFAEEPGRTLLRGKLEAIDGLKSLLTDYPCKVPALNRAFLVDGYKNVRNWVIDAGYDHGPWPYRLVLGTVLVGVTGLMFFLMSNNFDTTLTHRIQAWREHGFFANEWLLFDSLDQSYSFAGYVLSIGLNFLLNSPIPGWVPIFGAIHGNSRIFGQGTSGFFEHPTGVIIFKIAGYVYTAAKLALTLAAAKESEEPQPDPTRNDVQSLADLLQKRYFRWPRLLLDFARDILGNVLINKRNVDKGIEGDELSYELWLLQLLMAGVYFVSCAATFGIKSAQHDDDGNRQSGLQPLDIFLGMTFVAGGFFLFASLGFFDNRPLQHLVGTPWPDTTTQAVEAFLPLAPDGPERLKFADSGAQTFAVRLFDAADMRTVNGQAAYPQDKAQAKDSPVNTYTLPGLFKRTAYLSGALMMAAVNYDTGGAADKDATRQIFQDWNLDYRTVEEWNALMETGPANTVGLARAVDEWWNGPSSEAAVLETLQRAFSAPAFYYGRIEDRSAAPFNARQDTGHAYLANTPFTIVDHNGVTVLSGTTDANGNFSAALPPGQEYELRLAGYEGLGA
jgi:hypothetical protein